MDYQKIDFYETKKELIQYIALDTWSPYTKRVLYSLPIEEIKKDDILSVTTEFEVTNNAGMNLMIASSVNLCDSPTQIECPQISEANGFNISPQMHHGVVTHSRQLKIDNGAPYKYVNVVIWAASDAAKPSSVLNIEKGYGHLDVLVHKKMEG